MKLKTLIHLNEWVSNAPGAISSGDTGIVPWDSVTEGKGWFLYCGSNNYNNGFSTATVYLTEGKPKRFWLKIKTKKLRKPQDTNESFSNRAQEAVKKVGRAWCSEAKRLFKEPKSIDKVGNPTMRTWEECFREALNSLRIKSLIESSGESDQMIDPVNFTPRV